MASDPLATATRGLFSSSTGILTKGLLEEERHPRTEIRHHVQEQLVAETTAEGRIFASRFLPVGDEELADLGPVILVYTREDPADDEQVSVAPPVDRRRCQVSVEIIAHSRLEDLQDAVDAVALAVARIVLADHTQGGHAADTRLRNEAFVWDAEGRFPVAGLRLDFECEYHFSAEERVGDDFEGADVEWDVAEPDGTREARDTVELPQEEA